MRRRLTSCILILLFVSFLVFKDQVITGAAEGLLSWYRFVLPSLLPFMILVNIMIQTDTVSLLSRVMGPLMRYFPGVSAHGSFAVTAGFLCGYPMGAKVSADLIQAEKITYEEGSWLLSFCNNTSPMFIISILLTKFITDKSLELPFFLILMSAPLLCGQFFRLYYTRRSRKSFRSSNIFPQKLSAGKPASFTDIIDASLMDSFYAIVRVGLYMMLFSVFIQLFKRIIPGSGLCKLLLLSSMEVTTGLSLLADLTIPVYYRYILLMASVSFGGFCAVFQTASMIRESGLKIGPYIAEKLITATVTSLLTYLYLFSLPFLRP